VRTDGRYAVTFSKGETEFLEATGIKIAGGWITFYQENQPLMTVSSGAVERIEYPEQAELEPFFIN